MAAAACSSSTLAYAGMCKQDQWDRPIAGRANFCPNELDTSTGAWDKMIGTAIHEIGHALGFSDDSFSYMRDVEAHEDGTWWEKSSLELVREENERLARSRSGASEQTLRFAT